MRNLQTALRLTLGLLLAAPCASALALNFSLPWGEDAQIDGVLNTTLTAGAAWRMEDRSPDLVGKSNLDPDLCGRTADGHTLYQSCQGLFRTQSFPAERLAQGRGQYTVNADDGNLNYDKHDLVQAPLKVTSDLTLSLGDWGLFVKGLYFFDFVNNDFTERHPNRITASNHLDVGHASMPGQEIVPLALPLPVSLFVRNDSTKCPDYRNPSGGPCGIVYGRGGAVREKRSDGETLRQIGTDLQLLDAFVYGRLPLWGEKELTFKLGRQAVNWGESTLLVFDSINTVNPVNANNFYRTGFQVEEVFQPVGMAFLSMEAFENTTLEGFYQYEWQPLEAPAPGSYLSFLDVGSNNAISNLNIGFGGGAEDPDSMGILLDNPLSGLTNTTSTAQRLRDREPDGGGQYGIALKYYAEWLNEGTELGFYFSNTHARNPYVSVYSVDEGCAKHTSSSVAFLLACADIPLLHAALGGANDPAGATDNAVPFDTLKIQLEYPEDIRMYGLSFNTTAGDLSLQGEVAYRPDAPLQVDVEDLAFAGFGPTLSNCHLPDAGCAGTGNGSGLVTGLLPLPLQRLVTGLLDGLSQAGLPLDMVGGVGVYQDPSVCALRAPVLDAQGVCVYSGSDFVVDAAGTPGAYTDSYDLLIGHMVGSGRAFPSFIVPYRGGVVGTNPANSYIRGWEHFDSYQFNFGGTYVAGATDNPLGADQVILLFETGATWVPELPALNELQLEAPGTFNHASAGADGSGSQYRDAASQRQACSSNQACSWGPDGERFNPHQQDLRGYPDKVSWGYVLISQIKYESVLPGISLMPQIIWKHDVDGTSPGLASNFVEGRKTAALVVETRYKSALSLNLGYTWFTGGGVYNLYRDRDFAQAFVKVQF
ncbi:MAG TPA: DUF1302 family protein [Solimonas sp.]|nr:DUF1302 family protein [Solimonas sp.]